MNKEFLSYDVVRNDALKLAYKIYNEDNFVPDIIYCSLRGGAYMANVISEYYKVVRMNQKPVFYAAFVARSYSDVQKKSSRFYVDGWTYPPENIRPDAQIMLVDDIYDSGNTINSITNIFMDRGVPRKNIKVVVHDYKKFGYKEEYPVVPDYYCRLIEIPKPEDDIWIHYMSHELIGLEPDELKKYYYSADMELEKVLGPILGKK